MASGLYVLYVSVYIEQPLTLILFPSPGQKDAFFNAERYSWHVAHGCMVTEESGREKHRMAML